MSKISEDVRNVLEDIVSLVVQDSEIGVSCEGGLLSPVFSWPAEGATKTTNLTSSNETMQKQNDLLKNPIDVGWNSDSCAVNTFVSNLCNTVIVPRGKNPAPSSFHLDDDCGAPIQHLFNMLSPTSVSCIMEELNISSSPVNSINQDFKFLNKISPKSVLKYMREFQEEQPQFVEAADMVQIHDRESVAGTGDKEDENQQMYYPGSMLRRNSNFTKSPSVLENYLNADEEVQPIVHDTNTYVQQCNNEAGTSTKYEEEIISSSYQNIWQNINLSGFNYPAGNLLPTPTILSNYPEMANLQNELQPMNGTDQYVLPVFFQQYPMVTTQYAESNQCDGDEKKLIDSKSTQKSDSVEKKIFATLGNIVKDAKNWTDYDEELLKKCQMACFESEHYNNIPASEIEIPATSPHNDSMKYLEEAALQLLKSSARRKPARRRYRKRAVKVQPEIYVCKVCGKTFNRAFTLNTHERVHSGSRPYQCEFCHKMFRQSGTKRNHIRAVHAKEKPYKCEFCPKIFAHKSSLVVHTRIHTNEKPYECKVCARKFTDRATFKKHDAIHTREKRYKCTICGKCLTQHSNLKRHIKAMHQENLSKYGFKSLMEKIPETTKT